MNLVDRNLCWAAMLAIAIPFASLAVDSDDTPWKKHILQPASETRGMINTAVAADFDKDGHIDALASFNGGVVLIPGPDLNTQIVVHQLAPLRPGQKPSGGCIHSCLLDVDGDGDLDILIAGHVSNNLVWFENPAK